MPYTITLYIASANGLEKHLSHWVQQQTALGRDYIVVIRNLFKKPILHKDEKVYPLSHWRRALPPSAAELVRALEHRQEIIGLDFEFKLG